MHILNIDNNEKKCFLITKGVMNWKIKNWYLRGPDIMEVSELNLVLV